MTGSGLTRTIVGQVTNTGTVDVHNAYSIIEVRSAGALVQVNGQNSTRVDMGTIKAGATVNPQSTITISLNDGMKIAQSGAQVTMTIYSDEHTQSFTYDYKP
jgi:hypothetical protein